MTNARLTANSSALMVVDIQERLLPAVEPFADTIVNSTRLLVEAARLFAVPTIVSEQYPQGLGPTIGPIAERLQDAQVMAKTTFSAVQNEPLRAALQATEKSNIVICGIEAHICVLQTALDLVAEGYTVHVAADGIGSRDPLNREIAMDLLRQSGVFITTSETVAFQWAGQAGTPEFKALSKLVR